MNNKLNLASKPFTNRTLPWLVTGVVLLFSLVAIVGIVRSTRLANAEAATLQNDVRKYRQEEAALQVEAQKVKESLTPEQSTSLKAAHELVDRKTFSWSRLFMDLEAALPGNVRVTRISVRDVAVRGGQTVADLELAVVSQSSETVTNMIASMERAGILSAYIETQNLLKGRGESGTEYELRVIYRPSAGFPSGDTQTSSIAQASKEPPATDGGPK